tara:strand:- start:2273 stop:2494 length:222 start_codon:yes stop_codon:yes gene_type:complete
LYQVTEFKSMPSPTGSVEFPFQGGLFPVPAPVQMLIVKNTPMASAAAAPMLANPVSRRVRSARYRTVNIADPG